MKNDKINSILTSIAEDAVPSAEIDLWKTISQHLATSESSLNKKRKTLMKSNFAQELMMRRLSFAMLAIVIALGILFATPQGRAWAQALLRFFEKGTGMPVAPSIGGFFPTHTPQPTYMAELATSSPGETDAGAFLTPTPAGTDKSDGVIYNLTLEAAQELASFDIHVPAVVPAGYRLSEISFDRKIGEVWQIYKFWPYQSGEMFIVRQSPTNVLIDIGQTATVEQIQVGDKQVEYVEGMWFAEQGAAREAWDINTPIHTFRWEDGGIYFTLQFFVGDTFSPAYLSRQDMLAMVEVVMNLRAVLPDKVNLNYLTSYDAAEEAAGFDILTPSVLPEGFIFSHAVYEPENERVVLLYRPEDGSRYSSGVSLVIFEIPIDIVTAPVSPDGFPAEAIEDVSIGDWSGTIIRGAVVDGIYNPDFGWSLHWETNALRVTLNYYGSDYPAQLDQAGLLAIAESMR